MSKLHIPQYKLSTLALNLFEQMLQIHPPEYAELFLF